ncbi:MAG TPA: rod shape-determining protein MreC [Nitrolancea sp.]|nr:rod shape-determining protein MreC [Nitrolancea sp.]
MLSTTARHTAVLVFCFVAFAGTLIVLDNHHRLDAAKTPLETLLHPFVAGLSAAGDDLRGLSHRNQSDLAKQLQAVTAERDQLLAENAKLQQLQGEVDQLRKQLDFKEAHPGLTPLSANVIGHDPSAAHQILVLDRGSDDGIQKGMAVISPDFYVGQVSEVTPERARVILAIDASAHVGGMVQRSKAIGVLDGRWQAGGYFQLDHLKASDDVVAGDVIVTSAGTARVPEGLVVGKVSRVDREVQADTVTAQVTPLIDYSALRSVTVILSAGNGQ